MHGLFITGTDTGVGKTRIGTTLAHCLVGRGVRVRVRKPVESGCLRGENGLLPQDALALHAAARSAEPLERVCRYCLEAAISPERAAALEGLALNLDLLLAACRAGTSGEDFLLVEGAGGFYSPLAPGVLNADLAAALGLPVLLVAADRLGAINHALLTVQAIERHGLAFAGLVLNAAAPVHDPRMDNAADLERWLARPVSRVPHRPMSASGANTGAELAPYLDDLAEQLLAGCRAAGMNPAGEIERGE
jgi:dethiobiotin synthetase